ncbi:hypothetical protein N7456_012723 [Penicillium angulare]|uniref:Cytochrome P450 n=1 Tax=Penicillium angulare TaxID=116970 RepID=A0A9W9JVV9_9EURO|nr:hypothetical protein N7456_012723 [Penicillium angulare]
MGEPVFGVYLSGKTHNVVVSPSMIQTVLSSQDVSNADVLDRALRNVFGDKGLTRNLHLSHEQDINDNVPSMINREPFVRETSLSITRSLQRHVSSLVSFSRSPVDQFPWERDSCVELLEQDQPACEVELFSLIREFVGHQITGILLGEAFLDSFPGFLSQVWRLESNFVSLFVGFKRWAPSPGVSAGHAAREQLLHIMSVLYRAFTACDDGMDPGIELRDLDDMSDLFKQRMRTFRKLGLSPRASAAGTLSLYCDWMEHIVNITFWNLIHIFSDDELLKEIRKEITPFAETSRPNRKETGFPFTEPPKLKLDVEKLLQACPLLKACHCETIRLHSSGISFRRLESDLTLTESIGEALAPRTYKIPKGQSVIMPHGVFQNDPTRFSNPDQYDPLRYITTDSSSGSKKVNPDILGPLADGLYVTKENNFTERAILSLTASIISMWNISSPGKEFVVPRQKNTWGSSRPAQDVKVNIRARV